MPTTQPTPIVPLPLHARAKFKTHRTIFFQNLAFPRSLLGHIHNSGDTIRQEWELFSTWRLDTPSVDPSKDNITSIVLQVALKILTRGRLTVVSPSLEKKIFQIMGLDVTNIPAIIQGNYFKMVSPMSEADVWFDSDTEKYFYWRFLPQLLGPAYRHMTLPQVKFSSLVNRSEVDATILNQRVDFLITTPDKRIIVELNGADHDAHMACDEARRLLLTAAGYEVIFIQNDEVQSGVGANIQRLCDLLSGLRENDNIDTNQSDSLLSCFNFAHQLQVIVINALLQGNITNQAKIFIDKNSLCLPPELITKVIKGSMQDLREMVYRLSNIYSAGLSLKGIDARVATRRSRTADLFITYGDDLHQNIPTICVQPIAFRGSVSLEQKSSELPEVNQVNEKDITYFLNYLFGHQQLREGQYDAVYRTLTGKDTIVVLPTGHGKSAAFQLSSMLMPGVTIVIDPILALIDDQLDNLNRIGIDRGVGISSQIENPNLRSDIINAFAQGQYIFCYIAPERFQTIDFRDALRTLTLTIPIALIAIDEVHCVSEWGHDFRTAYLNIGRTSRAYCRSQGGRIPPLLCSTGTASHAVLRDVQRELQIEDFDAIITQTSFNREELHFAVFSVTSAEKLSILRGLLQRWLPEKFNRDQQSFLEPNAEATFCGLIFCPNINGPFGVKDISASLRQELQIPVHIYSGAPPRGWNNPARWVAYKKAVAKNFKGNQFPLLVATKAYGMGIDKRNIRYTAHYCLPPSIEAFYQEAGRAGRDRQSAECIVIFSNDFPDRTQKLLSPQTTPEQIAQIMEEERDWNSDDDITRVMYFHSIAFQGMDSELNNISHIIEKLGDIQTARNCNIVSDLRTRQQDEKAIYRLLVLGVIIDYTIKFVADEFCITLSGAMKEQIVDAYLKYVQGYNRGRVVSEREKITCHLSEEPYTFVLSACRILIEFIYNTIERGRRRALSEMLLLSEKAKGGNADSIIRERVQRYFGFTYSQELEDILSETKEFSKLTQLVDGLAEISEGEMLGGIRSPNDAQELRGQVIRYLESVPDHPGLLILRAVSEAYCPDCAMPTIIDNLQAATNFALQPYNIETSVTADIIAWALVKVYERRTESYGAFATQFFYHRDDLELTRLILASSNLHEGMSLEPAQYLIGKLCDKLAEGIYERQEDYG